MGTFWRDLRYAARMLLRTPAFTLPAVLTIALGTGANTSVFSFVHAILLQPLPFAESDRLVFICESNPEKGREHGTVAPKNLADWQRLSRTIEEFGAWRDWRFTLKGAEGAEGVPAGIASPSLFRLLRVQPVLGRTFLPEEDQPGRSRVVLLSYAYWQRRFGGDKGILGQSLQLDNELYTVVGVLPQDFNTPSLGWMGLWAPHSVDPDLQIPGRWLRNRRVYARLKPGVELAGARQEMEGIARQLAQQHPADNAGWSVRVTPLLDEEVGNVRPALFVFTAAVGFLLLIACVNVANLLLARSTSRQREAAIRCAMGASRGRLLRLFLTESILLGVLGGLLGLLLALWSLEAFIALSPRFLPRLEEVRISAPVLSFTFLLALLTGALFGWVPAWQAARVDLPEVLKEGRRSTLGARGMRLRNALLVAEVALALILLTGAGLLIRTFVRLSQMPLGFAPQNVLAVSVFLPDAKYRTQAQVQDFYLRAARELETIPGVQSVGATSSGPMFGGRETEEFLVEGRPAPAPGQNPQARFHNISPGYFRTMKIPLLRGRDFTDTDNAAAPPVVIVNDTFARRYFNGVDPIGGRLRMANSGGTYEIVGVVGDVERLQPDARVEPEIYWCHLQQARWATFFLLRTPSSPAGFAPAVRRRLAALDPDVLVASSRTLEEFIARTLHTPRFHVFVLGTFALIAVLLAAVGVYGVMAYAVAQRTHEIGVRVALGAQSGDVFRHVLRQGAGVAAAGVSIGVAGALALTRFLRVLLFGLSPTDPFTFASLAALLVGVLLLACYLPARRATRVDPAVVLRYE